MCLHCTPRKKTTNFDVTVISSIGVAGAINSGKKTMQKTYYLIHEAQAKKQMKTNAQHKCVHLFDDDDDENWASSNAKICVCGQFARNR